MKSKIIKTSLVLIGIILLILGIRQIVHYEVTALQASVSQANASTSTATVGKIVMGSNPSSYGYRVNTGTWECTDWYTEDTWAPKYGSYQIYCVQPGTYNVYKYRIGYSRTLSESYDRDKHTGTPVTDTNAREYQSEWNNELAERYASDCVYYSGHGGTGKYSGYTTPVVYKPAGTSALPVAAAYIVSDETVGRFTHNKQRAIWNLRWSTLSDGSSANGGLVSGSARSKYGDGASSLDGEAIDYANYDIEVRGKGVQAEDTTGSPLTLVDQSSKLYTVGPFSLDYIWGKSGSVTFSGISDMKVLGHNSSGSVVNEDMKIEKLVIGSSQKTPDYFKPSSNLKVDETSQVYPQPGQSFYIVFKDPNEGLSANDSNRVTAVSVKVKLQYMLANGKYTKLTGTKYTISYSCDHSFERHTCTRYRYISNGDGTYDIYTYTVSCSGCKKRLNLSSSGQQGTMVADAIRTVYEEEIILLEDDPADITMELGGDVWEDIRGGKETLPDGYNSGEPAVDGIPVKLYTKDGDKEEVVGSTTTSGSGKYSFNNLDAMKKYFIEFQYNGQQYENTIYTDDLSGGYSNASESKKDRDALNQKYAEIDGNEGYSLEELDEYYLGGLFKISAYTGSDGKEEEGLVLYPKYKQFVIGTTDRTVGGKKYEAIYQKGDSQKEIDFGITKRIEFDMAVKKDVYVATVKVNGKTEVYGYDKKNLEANDGTAGDEWNITVVGGYERAIDNADYGFTGQNGNNQLLEVYVTYKVAVRNQSQSMLGQVTKLYDYYDSTYEYVPELSWSSSTNYRTSKGQLDQLQDLMEAGSTNSLGSRVNASAGNGQLTINVGKKQSTGETVYLYLTFKLKGEGPSVELGEKTNKVEIGAFRTYYASGTVLPHYDGENNYTVSGDGMVAGRVDRDSIPSTMGPNGTPEEDDEDEAPGLNVHLTGGTRQLNGTVWEDERTENSGQAAIGNGKKDSGEIGIAGVTVQLVEKTVQGTEYVWQVAETGGSGTYNFGGYVAGDYIVRFTYGDSIATVATKANGGSNDVSYNGQDFKSTSYQVGITQSSTTDLDGKYRGYLDVNVQNETGTYEDEVTYGYDIAAAEGANVSDAKDIWSRRQDVNAYSMGEITNAKAEILASPYSGNAAGISQLIANTSMVAETGVIVVEVEKNIQSTVNGEGGQPSYSLTGIDLGLVERPKAQLEIDKSITNVKVVLANSSVLFDVKGSADDVIWKDHEEYGLASKKENGKYKDYYAVAGKHRYSYRDDSSFPLNKADRGLIQLTMDEEIMHGATIQITYKVKLTNAGEVDYTGQKFYYTGEGGGSVVTTAGTRVVDYVANNLKFDKNTAENSGWSIVEKDTLKNGLVNDSLDAKIDKFNNIIQTGNLGASLVPGGTKETTLVLTQLITSENSSDDLTYNNVVEILSTSNTVGRRMAYSIVGNQDPTASKASEVDSSFAERVIILPPFGNVHIFYILGAVIGIILISGITLIIKKVLKK